MEQAVGTPNLEVTLPGPLSPSGERTKAADYLYQGAIIAAVLLLLLTAAI